MKKYCLTVMIWVTLNGGPSHHVPADIGLKSSHLSGFDRDLNQQESRRTGIFTHLAHPL
jgi:hypothetical protein